MFVVFEGIDGSGKTTISNRATRALRESGLTVSHVREGGKLASTIGDDGASAFALRDALYATVVKSLGALAHTRRGGALVARLLRRHPDDLSLLKHAAKIELTALASGEMRAA